MTISSLGDLAMSFQMRRDVGRIKTDLARVTSELSSGTVSDVSSRLRGDFGGLSGIENSLARISGYATVIDEYRFFMAGQQSTVQKLRDIGSVSATFLTLPDAAADSVVLASTGAEALASFEAALGSLNTQAGGRTLFSGTATNQPAVADAEVILTAIEADIALAGAVTAADVESVVTTWFGLGGGYETQGYLGGPRSNTPVQLSESEVAQPAVTGEDPAVREQLSSLALAALTGRSGSTLAPAERADLVRRAGERLLASNDQLVALQAGIGVVEATIDRASAEVNGERDALEIAKAALIEIDPYNSATELQNAEAQLQTVYALTARLSRLSLVEYLR